MPPQAHPGYCLPRPKQVRMVLLLSFLMNWKWKLGTTCNVQTVMMPWTDNAAYFFCLLNICTKMNVNSHIAINQKLFIDLIYSEIDLTLSSLETLAKVFDHPSCSLTHTKTQVEYKPRCVVWQRSTVEDKGAFLYIHVHQLIAPFVLYFWMKGPEMEIDSLLCKISALVSLLSSLEKKVC